MAAVIGSEMIGPLVLPMYNLMVTAVPLVPDISVPVIVRHVPEGSVMPVMEQTVTSLPVIATDA
jgi:hypothetical protein